MGILQFNKNNNERAKDELKHILQLLNEHLRTRTYFVGERITLADITIACDLLLLFQWVQSLIIRNLQFLYFNFFRQIIDHSIRETNRNVTRWFLTVINQKEFQAVIGTDFKLCEKTAQPDGKIQQARELNS